MADDGIYINPTAGLRAARMAGKSTEMTALAKLVEEAVIYNAATHVDSGDFIASIDTVSVAGPAGVKDRAIVSNDENAFAIELGWTKNGRHHEGQHIFSKTVRDFG